jgi:hypothetical protein
MGGEMNTFEFDALFGSPAETKKAAAIRSEPALPWDADPLWSLTSPSEASATACAKIESDAFLKGILGEMPQPVTPEPVTFEKIFDTPQASASLAKLTETLSKKGNTDTEVTRIVRLANGATLTNPTYDKRGRCWWQDGVRFAGDLVSVEVK